MNRFYDDIIDYIIALRITIALTILVIDFLIGSLGYHFIEGMVFFDGFYITFITIITIGFTVVKISEHLKNVSPNMSL